MVNSFYLKLRLKNCKPGAGLQPKPLKIWTYPLYALFKHIGKSSFAFLSFPGFNNP